MTAVQQPPKLLLVEGTDDERFVKTLLERHSIAGSFETANKLGYRNLQPSIYPEAMVAGRTALGIVADANEDPSGRWQSISDQLKRAGFSPPEDSRCAGIVLCKTQPAPLRAGVWLMPDNNGPGELEDLLAGMIRDDDPAWPRAREYVEGIPRDRRAFKPSKLTRACLYAWLATREEPRHIGLATKAGDFDHKTAEAVRFVNWLRRLFEF